MLVEFAVVALALFMLLAATIEFGRALFGTQVLQQAADIAAREIARTPGLPVVGTLVDWCDTGNLSAAFNSDVVRLTVFDPQYLVMPLGTGLDAFNDKPIVNRLLAPLMIVDHSNNVLRYPGALVSDSNMPSGFTVMIPVVSDAGGVESVAPNLLPVIQEILPDPTLDPASSYAADQSPFSLASNVQPASNRGIVALRINYPFQAASMSAAAPSDSWPPDPNFQLIPVPPDEAGEVAGTYAGPLGLGNQLAMGQNVRPFRKLISAQAIYRREVFGP